MKSTFSKHRCGTALVTALVCSAVIITVGAATFTAIQTKYRSIHQTASWKESLLTAEGGVEMAMNEIRKNLYDPEHAFEGWGHTVEPITSTGSTAPGASSQLMTYTFESNAIVREGEGANQSWANVTVDAPRCLVDRSNDQWYRIRSLGVAEVPSTGVVAGEKADTRLRKFDFFRDRRSGRNLMRPQAARLIEAIAKPVGAFRLALFGIKSVDMTDHNIVVDSYDSRDDAKSTNGGYDINKRQQNADVATNGQLINAGSAHIYGDAFTNGGTVLNSTNVTGEIRSDFFQEVLPVQPPSVGPDAGTPAYITSSATIDAAPNNPTNYQLSNLSLSGQSVLRIRGATDGSATYCQIVVTGNVGLSGQAQIKLDPGVYVRIFVKGDMDIAGNGFLNPNSPLALQVYGCDRATASGGVPTSYGQMKIAGNGGFCGCVYAPNYDLNLKGGGNADTVFGAFVANTINMTGVQSVHYDESLADGGLINDYKIVSWFEDER